MGNVNPKYFDEVNANVFDNLNVLIDNFVDYCSHADQVDRKRKTQARRQSMMTETTVQAESSMNRKQKRMSQNVRPVPNLEKEKKNFSKRMKKKMCKKL